MINNGSLKPTPSGPSFMGFGKMESVEMEARGELPGLYISTPYDLVCGTIISNWLILKPLRYSAPIEPV